MTLHQLISENRTKPNYKDKLKQQSKQIFTSRKLPQISISDYVIRIVKLDIRMYHFNEKSCIND